LKEGLEECKLLFLSSETNCYNSFFLLLKKSLQFFFKNLSLLSVSEAYAQHFHPGSFASQQAYPGGLL
jgi:hypothetical protein